MNINACSAAKLELCRGKKFSPMKDHTLNFEFIQNQNKN